MSRSKILSSIINDLIKADTSEENRDKFKKAITDDDLIITSSNKLKSHLIDSYKKITVIEDPIEIEIQILVAGK